jgi:hypothetical protein
MTAGAPTRPVATNLGAAAMSRALGYDRRSQLIGTAVAVVGPLLAAVACWGRASFPVMVVATLVPTPVILAVAALTRRRLWAAEEVLCRNVIGTDEEWRSATGGPAPRTVGQANVWLLRHRPEMEPAYCTAFALLVARRYDQARAAIGALPGGTPGELHRRLDLEMSLRVIDGLPIEDQARAADDAARSDPGDDPATLASNLALHAMLVAQSHGGDGLAAVAEARPQLGSLRGKWASYVWRSRLRFAICAFLVGAWILVAIALSGAAAGGVFWL